MQQEKNLQFSLNKQNYHCFYMVQNSLQITDFNAISLYNFTTIKYTDRGKKTYKNNGGAKK